MPKANMLTRLKIREVSSVDRGAGEGVRVVFSKRAGDGWEIENLVAKTIAQVGLGDTIITADGVAKLGAAPEQVDPVCIRAAEVRLYAKREFSQEERDAAAKSGAALPDGSFPIHNVGDLKNAIHAFGRAKDKAKAKAHIIGRARALGQSDLIPDTWSTKKGWVAAIVDRIRKLGGDAVDFDEAQEAIEAGEYAQGMLDEIDEACCALRTSVTSIMCDEDLADKQAALETTFQQFKDHMQGIVPEWMEKSLTAAGIAAAMAKGAANMPDNIQVSDQVKKLMADPAGIQALLDSVAKAKQDAEDDKKKAEKALRIAKMSEKHQAYHAQLSGDEKDKFEAMEPGERDDHMQKNPIEKRFLDTLPESVRKSLAAGQEALAKLKKADDEKDEKDAEDKEKALNLPKGTAKTLAKSLRDPAVTALLAHVETLNKQLETSDLFKNFGSRRTGGGVTGYGQLVAKADELRKANPKLTAEQAFAKVYQDPANAEMVALSKRDGSAQSAAA